MSTLQAVLWILGVAIAIAAVCAVSISIGNQKESKMYDERQKAARNEGYRVAFYVGAVYYAYMIPNLKGKNYLGVEPYLLLLFGLLMQILTVHIYALLKDSALPLGEKPGWMAATYTVWGINHLLNMPRYHTDVVGLPLMGYGSEKWIYFSTGCLFFLLALSHLISMLRHRKDKEEE